MTPGCFRFADYSLDPADRLLRRGDAPVDLNARYLDALILLVSERGRLVSKDRFMAEVWRGVPVTDEALTQCIRTLRNRLGDDAGRPRFIETAPKHGYRFIAPVTWVDPGGEAKAATSSAPAATPAWRRKLRLGVAGTLGGGTAGLLGGLIYGLVAAADPAQTGAASALAVLVCVTVAIGLLGGAGVGFGVAATTGAATTGAATTGAATTGQAGRPTALAVLGGAIGGGVVGGLVRLLGQDAFNLLLGRSPGDITGGVEGLVLGGAIGLGIWLGAGGTGRGSLRRGMAFAGLGGALGGGIITLSGGHLLAGSLDVLARQFPASRLKLDAIGIAFGETGLGPVSQTVTGCLEGLLFGACVGGALVLARRGALLGTREPRSASRLPG